MPIKPVSGEIDSQEINNNFSYLDSKIEQTRTGPLDTLTSLAQLNQKYPNGANGTVVVLEPDGETGYEYTWTDGAWKKGAVRQSQGIPDNSLTNEKYRKASITEDKTAFLEIGLNKLDLDKVVRGAFVNANSGNITNNLSYCYYEFNVTPGTYINIKSDWGNVTPRTFRHIVSYDIQGNFLPNKSFDNSEGSTDAWLVPEGVYKVAVSFLTSILDSSYKPMIYESDSDHSDVGYEDYKLYLRYLELTDNQLRKVGRGKLNGRTLIADHSITANLVDFYKSGRNLFNPKYITDEKFKEPNGREVENELYYFTDPIKIELGQKVYAFNRSNQRVHYRKVTAYDKFLNEIVEEGQDNPQGNGLVSSYECTNENVAYISVSIGSKTPLQWRSTPENLMLSYDEPNNFVEYALKPEEYIGFSEKQIQVIEGLMNGEVSNRLTDKSILNLGDSIAAGDGNNGNGYAEIIAQENGMICYDYAQGGATLTKNINLSNNIVSQLDRALSELNEDPDFVLINGRTNDIGGNYVDTRQVGTIRSAFDTTTFDYDLDTFIGSMEYIIAKIKSEWPDAIVIFVSVHKMDSRNSSLQQTYHDASIIVAKKWAIGVANLFEEGQLNTQISQMHQFSNPTEISPNGDRTHPNDLGYRKFYVPQISKIMLKYL